MDQYHAVTRDVSVHRTMGLVRDRAKGRMTEIWMTEKWVTEKWVTEKWKPIFLSSMFLSCIFLSEVTVQDEDPVNHGNIGTGRCDHRPCVSVRLRGAWSVVSVAYRASGPSVGQYHAVSRDVSVDRIKGLTGQED